MLRFEECMNDYYAARANIYNQILAKIHIGLLGKDGISLGENVEKLANRPRSQATLRYKDTPVITRMSTYCNTIFIAFPEIPTLVRPTVWHYEERKYKPDLTAPLRTKFIQVKGAVNTNTEDLYNLIVTLYIKHTLLVNKHDKLQKELNANRNT